MRDHLVRYLLGELDFKERRLLEEQLQKSPELRRELAYLRECLPSPESPEPPLAAPPMGLAERTVDRVADAAAGLPYDEEAELRASANRALVASYAVEPALRIAELEPGGFDGCGRRVLGREHVVLARAAAEPRHVAAERLCATICVTWA